MKTNLTKRTLIVVAVLLLVNVGYGAGYTRWLKNVDTHNISFVRLRYCIERADTLSIIGFLRTDTRIDGFPCRAGWVHFTKDWRLRLFRLSENYIFHNIALEKGTWVFLSRTQNRFTVVFPKDTIIDGYPCKGSGGVKGIQTSFYNSGKLCEFFPAGTVTVDGIKCKGGVFHPVRLYENGRLAVATLAAKTAFDGQTLRKGTVIRLTATGHLIDESTSTLPTKGFHGLALSVHI